MLYESSTHIYIGFLSFLLLAVLHCIKINILNHGKFRAPMKTCIYIDMAAAFCFKQSHILGKQ